MRFDQLRPYFIGWTDLEIKDHLKIWRNRGEVALLEWIERGNDMQRVLLCSNTPEEYDSYRVDTYGCIPMLRTIKRKWKDELIEVCGRALAGDRAVYTYLFESWADR